MTPGYVFASRMVLGELKTRTQRCCCWFQIMANTMPMRWSSGLSVKARNCSSTHIHEAGEAKPKHVAASRMVVALEILYQRAAGLC